MKISSMLRSESIQIPLAADTKADALRELVALLPSAANPEHRDRLHEVVVEREERMSTGIGQGVAIPHGKSDLVPSMEAAFGIAKPPLPFDSLDGQPVEIILLLVSPPEQTGPHIKALAQVSRILSPDPIRHELQAAATPEQILQIIAREEAALGD